MNCATTSQEDKDFNSKLVRLEEASLKRAIKRTAFQFQTGSIRSQASKTAAVESASFNSKLVRLEAGIHLENEKFIDGFQFQTGSIRSLQNMESIITL